MYKEAAQLKLRFTTSKGLLTVEQLFDLTLPELDALAVALDNEYKESGKKSFLVKRTSKDKIAKLKFDIAIDVLNTKAEEAEVKTQESERKAYNEKIFAAIANSEEKELSNKTPEQLRKMLK